MQHRNSLRMSSAPRRWPYWSLISVVTATVVLVLTAWFFTRPIERPPLDLAAYARDQAERTLSALGYHSVVGLSLGGDGSWSALAQKDGEGWRVRLSPYGAFSARANKPDIGAERMQQ